MENISAQATYSVEDNKLRLYFDDRLENEIYQRVRKMGFIWAPKQKLFVAPMWTPEREDFCLEFVDDIEAEDTTLLERAIEKAERLDNLALKRAKDANTFHEAAKRISKRFEFGQPILVGHHSERRARKDKERMESEMRKATKAYNSINYWKYRAEGVERHACRKSAPGVRARRIKTLLAELRDFQRKLNHANKCLILWSRIFEEEDLAKKRKATVWYAGAGDVAPYYKEKSLYSMLQDDEITVDEAISKCIDFHEYQATNPKTFRWINHVLNRLDYERNELGEVPRYEEELTPVILQAFAREQGADKPVAKKTEKGFILESIVSLPFHLTDGCTLELEENDWRDLMKSVGHQVVVKQRKKSSKETVPLINPSNEDANKLQKIWNSDATKTKYGKPSELRELTQGQYSANSKGSYTPFSTITIDQNGRKIWNSQRAKEKNQVAVFRVRTAHGGELYSADRVIVISDKPTKRIPLDLDSLLQLSEANSGVPA